MSNSKVAVVTGSNKGIGYAIVRALCKEFEGDVFLTARNESRGLEAVDSLKKEGLNPKFHQLDIDDHESIARLRDFLKSNYGGIDVLVNNAGIAYKAASTAPFSEQAEVTCKTNFFSTLDACNVLFPILKPNARVVHVSSGASTMALKKCSAEIQKRFRTAETVDDVSTAIKQFVVSAQHGNHTEQGYADWSYGVSKIGVTAMTYVQQRDMDKARPGEDIVINSCCPGYVDTDMTSHKGHLTIDQGAETPVFCATLPKGEKSIRGQFLSQKKVVDWR